MLEKLGIQERQRPFYVSWVRQFLRRRDKSHDSSELGRDAVETFLNSLRANPNVADWQVSQARDALEIHCERFRGILLGPEQVPEPRKGEEAKPAVVPQGGQALVKTMKGKTILKANLVALEEAVRSALRTEHYALKTERAYLYWIRRFITYHRGRRPSQMDAAEINEFLSHLAVKERVAASTQNQALNAIVFLYRKVVKKEIGDFSDFPRARRPRRLPTVLSRKEVQTLPSQMDGTEGLIARLLYGTGMRLSEGLRLRVQDLAFDCSEILVRAGKGDKDRRVPFPASLKAQVRQHLEARRRQYDEDREHGRHEVELPGALGRKYPKAPYEWKWQFVFAAGDHSVDPRTGARRRHHLHAIRVQRAVKRAAIKAHIDKRVTPHTLRHCFATLQPISWRQAMTSGRCRNCSAMRMFPLR